MYPPRAANTPCAMLRTRIRPMVTTSPIEMVKSTRPYDTPYSTMKISVDGKVMALTREWIAHRLDGVDDDVLQTAIHFLDPPDVNVLDDIARFRIELERTA